MIGRDTVAHEAEGHRRGVEQCDAGGCILASACDYRFGVLHPEKKYRLQMNEHLIKMALPR